MTSDDKSQQNLLMQTVREFSQDECPMMAASLAYYMIFSLAPLLVIVVTVAGLFWGDAVVRGRIADEMQGVVGEAGIAQLDAMLDSAQTKNRGIWATITGIALLLFGATGVMVQLQYALNKAFDVKPDPKKGGVRQFISKRLLSFAMILAIAFLLIVSLVLTTALTMVGDQLGAWLPETLSQFALMAADFVVSLVVIAVLFAALFKWLPDVKLKWRDVGLAGILTATLFMIGKFALGLYLGRQDPTAYGPAAALVLILIWVYYSAMIFFLGAEFAQVWSQRGDRRLHPEAGAIRRTGGI